MHPRHIEVIMNVLIRKQVEYLGRFGDVVRVADGYARNYLIPQGIAVPATPGNIKQFEAEKTAFLKKEAVRLEKARKLKAALDAVQLRFARKSGDDEKLFGSVTAHDIEAGLKEKGFDVDKKDITLKDPIKNIGLHTVGIKLLPEVVANVSVDVVKE